MALANGAKSSSQELLNAQAHVWNHLFSYVNCMSLKCAIQLGIADVIHQHGKPMTLSQLADALSVNKAKSHALFRLMRLLVHSKFFNKVKATSETEAEDVDVDAYGLNATSRLLLRDDPFSLVPLTLYMLDPVIVDPWHYTSEWFRNDSVTPFATKHGRTLWEHAAADKGLNVLLNEAMASDAWFVGSILTTEYMHVFQGLKSMVDVGGGTGATAKIMAAAFPDMKCTVLDLPHVVAGLEGYENLAFVGGDMFEFIIHADAVFLKWILHDWDAKDCVRILKKCKEAINSRGKLIVVEMVVMEGEKEEKEATETKLLFDLEMMAMVTGKERTEKEWAELFFAAGFTSYVITPVLGLRSVIEVYP